MLALKLRLNNEHPIDATTGREHEGTIYPIAIPLAICEPLNADFDGDTVSLYLVDPSVAEDTYQKMSPRYNYLYHKTNTIIYKPSLETLNGLNELSEVRPDLPEDLEDPKENYTSWKDLVMDAEVRKTLPTKKPIMFTGKIGTETYDHKITTYGRLKISKVIDADLDLIHIDDPLKPIDGKSGAKLYRYLCGQPDGPEKIKELQRIALQEVTKAGVVTFNFRNLTVNTNTETYQKLRAIVDDPTLSDKDKLLRVTDLYDKYCKEVQDQFDDDLKKELKRAGKVKLVSLGDMNTPQLIISGVDGKVSINHGSLLAGLDEKEYQIHAIENRSLQSIKQMGVPSSGSITRQVSFLCNNYQYEPGEDPDNECILIPRYRAVGRVAPDGKRYGKVVKQNEADLVPVRSIITKSKERDYVTPDLLNDYGYKDVAYGSGIGMAMATGFTESTTQSLLGLKHGGHERVLDRSGYLLAPKACKLSYDDTWIYLKVRGKELKYPKPENIVFMGPTEFQEGDIVGTAYNTTSPIYDLNAMVSLMRARGSAGIRYFERDNVIISDCYAINSGTIEYGTDKRGDITVKIGGVEYDYNPQCMYYFPDGAQVNKYDRICSGVVNINKVMREFGDDIRSSYLIFRNQLYSIIDKDFRVNKVLNTPGSIQEEIIEMLFISLSRVTYDEKTNKVKSIEFRGTNNGIMDNDSFYTVLSWGYASKAVSKALSGELKMKGDLMTETILGLLLNDKLDEKK